jgi:hypothetical protein
MLGSSFLILLIFPMTDTHCSSSSSSSSLSLKSCRSFRLEGSVFICEALLSNNTWKQVSIDLDLYIGLVNGQLTWDKKGFSKQVKSFRLSATEGWILIVEIDWTDSLTGVRSTRTLQLDLSVKIQNKNGVLVFIAFDENLSTMLSEVPWMKFRVIAEPDFSVLTTHPVMRSTMSSIAQSTVHHVMVEMSRKLSTAIEEAMTTVMKSAEEHIASAMETMLVGVSGSAHIERSCSQLSYLETLAATAEYGKFPYSNLPGRIGGGAKSLEVTMGEDGSLSAGAFGAHAGAISAGSVSAGGAIATGNLTGSATSLTQEQQSSVSSSESHSQSQSQSQSLSRSQSHSESQAYGQSGFVSQAAAAAGQGIGRVLSPPGRILSPPGQTGYH